MRCRSLSSAHVQDRLDKIGVGDGAESAKPHERLPSFTGKIELGADELTMARQHWGLPAGIDQRRAFKFAVGKMLAADIEPNRAEGLVFDPFDGSLSGKISICPRCMGRARQSRINRNSACGARHAGGAA